MRLMSYVDAKARARSYNSLVGDSSRWRFLQSRLAQQRDTTSKTTYLFPPSASRERQICAIGLTSKTSRVVVLVNGD